MKTEYSYKTSSPLTVGAYDTYEEALAAFRAEVESFRKDVSRGLKDGEYKKKEIAERTGENFYAFFKDALDGYTTWIAVTCCDADEIYW